MDNPQVLTATVAIIVVFIASIVLQPKRRPCLNPKQWQVYRLVKKTKVSPNTNLYRFALPRKTDTLGLPIGQHISVQAFINGKSVQRSYTPVSSDDDKGFFELMIKTYPDGNISRHMDELEIGDQLTVKGPKGQMKYHPHMSTKIGMICGGTGITPMLQLIRAIMKNPADTTEISLIYANVKPQDILLREELDKLAEQHPKRFKLWHSLNEPPEGWTMGTGFVSKEMVQDRLPAPAPDVKILLCGPPPMINAMKGHLAEIGYDKPRSISKMEDQVFCF